VKSNTLLSIAVYSNATNSESNERIWRAIEKESNVNGPIPTRVARRSETRWAVHSCKKPWIYHAYST